MAPQQELVLDRNRIRYIDPDAFVGLPRLRELRLEENGLRSLANLHHLSALQALHLSFNRVSEAADLDRLSSELVGRWGGVGDTVSAGHEP